MTAKKLGVVVAQNQGVLSRSQRCRAKAMEHRRSERAARLQWEKRLAEWHGKAADSYERQAEALDGQLRNYAA